MKIAIIGGGFAGLAASHFLKPHAEVTVYDPGTGSASSIAAGLLHKFVGMHAKKNINGDEALALSLSLIGPKQKTGLLRIPQNENQAEWFKKAASDFPDELQLDAQGNLWIEEAWVVDCPAYLETLPTIKKNIKNLAELADYDKIIITAGADCLNFFDLPVHRIRGQLLEIKGLNAPATPITGEAYLISLKNSQILGSTYERHVELDAKKELLPKLSGLVPKYELQEVVQVKAAYRASAPQHMPYIKQMDDRTWVYTGLGSKGLLYHAYYARELVKQMNLSLPVRDN